MTKYSLVMTPTPCRVAGGIISIRPTYSCACALTYLLTRITSVLCDWPVIYFPDFSANDMSSVPLPLVGPIIINVCGTDSTSLRHRAVCAATARHLFWTCCNAVPIVNFSGLFELNAALPFIQSTK